MSTPALSLLENVPGIADVVWGTLARLEGWRDPVRLLVASPKPRAGTSVIAAATAIGLVRHLRVPVCLVETNVERPAMARYLGLRNEGLSDVLDGRAKLEECIQGPSVLPNLFVLPAGTAREPVPGEFTTEKMRGILDGIGARGRYLVLDAPPLLDHLESRLLLQHADGALLVLRARETRADDAERAHRILNQSRTPLIGSIFNGYQRDSSFGAGFGDELRARLLRWTGRERANGDGPLPLLPHDARLDAPAEDAHLRFDEPEAATERVVVVAPAGTPEAHRRQVELLERRIAKLTRLLKQSEENLRRMAALKNVDPGIASIYRGVQGLSSEEDAWAVKKELMQRIFQANLELKNAVARLT